MYEMKEVYTLDEMIKLSALTQMASDIEAAKMKEINNK